MPALGASRATTRIAHRLIGHVLILTAALVVSTAWAGPRKDIYTNAGILGLSVTNLGYVGNAFETAYQPSGEYPLNSNVEHIFLGGIWVGAVAADGTIHVSTGAQDAQNLVDGDEIREFDYYYNDQDEGDPENRTYVWSNSQNSDNYDSRALGTQHIQAYLTDYANVESGNHVPLGLKVILRALAWGSPYADDFVILDYAIVNVSGTELRDVYVGYWNDTTIGNTENTNPYDPNAPVGWDFYDDANGGWGAQDWVNEENTVPDDPGIWMMYEFDPDGDEGLATSWVGTRLLGTRPEVAPLVDTAPVSYNAWQFRNVPEEDDNYLDDFLEEQPGKYQIMGNGAFTVGEINGVDYTTASDWVALISTGPIPTFADQDTIHVTFAVTCGADSVGLLANSKVAQVAYNDGFTIPAGPPSPKIAAAYEWDTIKLQWAPGDSVGAANQPLPPDDPRRSPEQHISTITGKPDFQGYQIYRYQGSTIDRDPYEISTLVAQFDVIDGIGFDTGLPPLNEDGLREFSDGDLLDGFPYWYAVISFSAPDLQEGLPSFQSGFNENALLLYPGPAAVDSGDELGVSVAPNPYRGGSYFDNPSGEIELGRKIWFLNLPPQSTIKIYTVAGDLVRTLQHNDPVDGKHEWDVLSDHGRAIATGLYVYVVKNDRTGEVQRGKLVIIK